MAKMYSAQNRSATMQYNSTMVYISQTVEKMAKIMLYNLGRLEIIDTLGDVILNLPK